MPRCAMLIANPKFTRANVEQVFLAVMGKELDEEGKNLIRLLLENGRLALLPKSLSSLKSSRPNKVA